MPKSSHIVPCQRRVDFHLSIYLIVHVYYVNSDSDYDYCYSINEIKDLAEAVGVLPTQRPARSNATSYHWTIVPSTLHNDRRILNRASVNSTTTTIDIVVDANEDESLTDCVW
ncbi:hypothetical protein J6590_036916 [Homalodisca vitripennis]|nr:hypothetical protein J6590_036916 [Homalodisca vitripennis]